MDEQLRELERAIQLDPTNLDARVAFFKAQIRISPNNVKVEYKIKEKRTGRFMSKSNHFTKGGTSWKSLEAVYKFISSMSGAHLQYLKSCELVEIQTLEATTHDDFEKTLVNIKLANLASQKAALEEQQKKLMKEMDSLRKP